MPSTCLFPTLQLDVFRQSQPPVRPTCAAPTPLAPPPARQHGEAVALAGAGRRLDRSEGGGSASSIHHGSGVTPVPDSTGHTRRVVEMETTQRGGWRRWRPGSRCHHDSPQHGGCPTTDQITPIPSDSEHGVPESSRAI